MRAAQYYAIGLEVELMNGAWYAFRFCFGSVGMLGSTYGLHKNSKPRSLPAGSANRSRKEVQPMYLLAFVVVLILLRKRRTRLRLDIEL